MSDEKKQDEVVKSTQTEAVVGFDVAELQSRIEEGVAKALEAKTKAEKKLNLNNTVSNKLELSKAEQEVEAVKFIKGLALSGKSFANDYATKNQLAGTDSIGGFTIPEVLQRGILANMDQYTQIVGAGNVTTINRPVTVNELATDVTVYQVAEADAVTGSTATFTQEVLTPKEWAGEMVLTDLLLDRSQEDLISFFVNRFSEQFAKSLENSVLNSATSGGEGIFVVSGTQVFTMGTTGAYTNVTWEDTFGLIREAEGDSIMEGQSGSFMMHPSTWDVIYSSAVSPGGEFRRVQSDPTAENVNRIKGRNVLLSNQIATPASSGTKFIAYADWKKHLWVGYEKNMRFNVVESGVSSTGFNFNTQRGKGLYLSLRAGHITALQNRIYLLVS